MISILGVQACFLQNHVSQKIRSPELSITMPARHMGLEQVGWGKLDATKLSQQRSCVLAGLGAQGGPSTKSLWLLPQLHKGH